MLILIAESKTMTACDREVSVADFSAHRPELDGVATAVMRTLADMDVAGLAAAVGISLPMAAQLKRMIYEFPDKSRGERAASAYTGVVFRAFGYATLPEASRGRADEVIRILSSAYGYLRPCDIIKEYRLDYKTRLAPADMTFAQYYRPHVTQLLCDELRNRADREVLSLLPAEAAKMIDGRRVSRMAGIWNVRFLQAGDGAVGSASGAGKLRTPHSGRLKELRGRLLRQIISDGICDVASLAGLESNDYVFETMDSDTRTVTFLTV